MHGHGGTRFATNDIRTIWRRATISTGTYCIIVYSEVLKVVDICDQARSNYKKRGRPSLPFFENGQKVPRLSKKYPDFVRLCIKFFTSNAVLRVFGKKTPNLFPVGPALFVLWIKCLLKFLLYFKKLPRLWKVPRCMPNWRVPLF